MIILNRKKLLISLGLAFIFSLGCKNMSDKNQATPASEDDGVRPGVMSALMALLLVKGKLGSVSGPLVFANSFTGIPIGGLFNSGNGIQVSLFEEDIKKIAAEIEIEINEQHLKENQTSMRAAFEMTGAYFMDKEKGYLPSVDSKLDRLGDITNRAIEAITQLEIHGLAGAKNRLLGRSLLIRIDHEEARISGHRKVSGLKSPVEDAHEMIESDRASLADLVEQLANKDMTRTKDTGLIYEVHDTSPAKGRKSIQHYKFCYTFGESETCTEDITCKARLESNAFCKIGHEARLPQFKEQFKSDAIEYYEMLIWDKVETVYQALDEADKIVGGEGEIEVDSSIDSQGEEIQSQGIEDQIGIPAASASLSFENIKQGEATLVITFPKKVPEAYTFGLDATKTFSAILISPVDVGFDPETRSFKLEKAARRFVLTIKSIFIKKEMKPTQVKSMLDMKTL